MNITILSRSKSFELTVSGVRLQWQLVRELQWYEDAKSGLILIDIFNSKTDFNAYVTYSPIPVPAGATSLPNNSNAFLSLCSTCNPHNSFSGVL